MKPLIPSLLLPPSIERANKANRFRAERKFIIDTLSLEQVEAIVRQNGLFFRGVFRPRRVNNIYLDTPNLDFYHQNKNGNLNRKKVRIRWYGETFEPAVNPVLEIKFKFNNAGEKASYPLKSIDLSRPLTREVLRKIVKDSDLPDSVFDMISGLKPTLLNSYKRKYFVSANNQVRATVDSSFGHKDLRGKFSTLTRRINKRSSVIILELKYDMYNDLSVTDHLSQFPFRLSKSSKYCDGVDLFSGSY